MLALAAAHRALAVRGVGQVLEQALQELLEPGVLGAPVGRQAGQAVGLGGPIGQLLRQEAAQQQQQKYQAQQQQQQQGQRCSRREEDCLKLGMIC